jgi:hypothetical protein
MAALTSTLVAMPSLDLTIESADFLYPYKETPTHIVVAIIAVAITVISVLLLLQNLLILIPNHFHFQY